MCLLTQNIGMTECSGVNCDIFDILFNTICLMWESFREGLDLATKSETRRHITRD